MSWIADVIGNLIGAAHTAGWFGKSPTAPKPQGSTRHLELDNDFDSAVIRATARRAALDDLLKGQERRVAAVSAVFFQHDPIGINFEDNTDEYDPEARMIVAGLVQLSDPLSEDALAMMLAGVFEVMFGQYREPSLYLPIAAALRQKGLA